MTDAGAQPVSYLGDLKERGADNPLDANLPAREQLTATDLVQHLLSLKDQIVTVYYRGERGSIRSLTGPLTGVLISGNDTFVQMAKGLVVNLDLVQFFHPGTQTEHRKQNDEIESGYGY